MDAAREKLAKEFDFEHVMSVLRISRFLAHLQLSRRQRLTVDFFRKYTVRRKDVDKAEANPPGMSVEAIVKGMRPREDSIDKRILYELSGLRLNDSDFKDDSSFEEDDQAIFGGGGGQSIHRT